MGGLLLIFDRRYINPVEYDSDNHLIMDKVKDFFNIQKSSGYQNNDITLFYRELLNFSNQLKLGSDISIDTIYDGKIPEKVFTIHSSITLNKKQKYQLSESIHEHMESFSNSQGLQNFFKDAYILIK